jgi:hypothetical protein
MPADAGHLPPWCRGEEMASPSSLSVGVAQDEHNLATRLDRAPGDRVSRNDDPNIPGENNSQATRGGVLCRASGQPDSNEYFYRQWKRSRAMQLRSEIFRCQALVLFKTS